MANKANVFEEANMVVEAFGVSIADYVGGTLGISATVNFYRLLCAYKNAHNDELDEAHQKMMDTTIDQAMAAMDAAFANE